MKVLLSTIGSRGDVQPLLALANELRVLGHEASLCVPPNFKEWVESFGVRCFPIGPDVKNFASAAPPGKPSMPSAEQRSQLASFTVRNQFETLPNVARGFDLIVGATALQIAAPSIAESLKIPYVFVAYCPAVLPAADYPPLLQMGTVHPQWLPGSRRAQISPSRQRKYFRLLWQHDAQSFDNLFLPTLNDQRAKLDLPPVVSARRHVFTEHPWLAADPTLAPAPSRTRMEIMQTGAWLLRDESPLPDDLQRFLASGEPPVYFGFGSMRGSDSTGRILIEAARALGLRSIISQGWGNLSVIDSGDDCLSIGDVDHEKLFPRVAAIVHHGGAGTTSTAARAGRPQVIVPHNYDQYYFSRSVQTLGIGASCLPRARLTVEALVHALRKCTKTDIKERAIALARRIVPDGAKIAALRLVDEFDRAR